MRMMSIMGFWFFGIFKSLQDGGGCRAAVGV